MNEKEKKVNVLIHDSQFSENDLVVNSSLFRVINIGDIIEIAWTASGADAAAASAGVQTQE